MPKKQRTYTVRILYKSGNSLDVECDHCSVDKRGGEITGIELQDSYPYMIYAGVDNIEAVWQISPERT